MAANETVSKVIDGLNEFAGTVKESLEVNKEIVESINSQGTVNEIVSTDNSGNSTNNLQLSANLYEGFFSFSKKILAVILGFFIVLVVVGIPIFLITGKDISHFIDYAKDLTTITVPTYFMKSAFENRSKIINNK